MTTQKRQPSQITRYEVFTVGEATPNDYGDLIVKDTQGNEYKIGNKRERLFEVFQVGAEVKVGYAVYMQKEYIASAEQTGKHIPEVSNVEKAGAKVETANIIDTKNRSYALSYSKDIVCQLIESVPSTTKTPTELAQITINIAKQFEKYLEGD